MNSCHQGQATGFPPKAKYLAVLGLGICAGLLVLFLADREVRWIIFSAIGLVGVLVFIVTPAKHRLLTAIFILSLQIDVYLRLLYGRAGTGGLAIPLVVLTGAALVAWYASSGLLNRFKWAGSLRLPILALFATTLISLLTTSERFVGLTTVWDSLELYFLYWLTFNLVQSQDDFRRIIYLLLVTLAAQSIVYLIQSSLGVTFNLIGETIEEGEIPRPGGTVSANPAGFASFIMPALFISMAAVMAKDRFLPGPYVLVPMVLGMIAIGLTFTRAAWIGLALGLAAIVQLSYKRRAVRGSRILLIAAGASVGAVVLLPAMLTRVSGDYAGTTATIEERLGLIRIALNVIAAHPLTGVGPGAYGHVYKSYVPGDMDQWLFIVHNEFLLRAAETGIPGALAFVFLLVVGFRIALRLTRTGPSLISTCALGWFGALVAVVWQMNWVPWIGWSYNAMFWFMLGLMDGAHQILARDEAA